jgi:hypothetical protein
MMKDLPRFLDIETCSVKIRKSGLEGEGGAYMNNLDADGKMVVRRCLEFDDHKELK